MDRDDIHNRMNDLWIVLNYSLKKDRHLTIGQRICIHQELSSWFRVLEQEIITNRNNTPRYKVPVKIENAIQGILRKINPKVISN